jgi:hypothetical protein
MTKGADPRKRKDRQKEIKNTSSDQKAHTTKVTFEILTITSHAHGQALLKAAVLTAIAMVLSHFTVLVPSALVPQLLTN